MISSIFSSSIFYLGLTSSFPPHPDSLTDEAVHISLQLHMHQKRTFFEVRLLLPHKHRRSMSCESCLNGTGQFSKL